MKTSVEINGYTISIEESEGIISVNAIKDEEVVEEFTIQMEEAQEGEESDDDSDGIRKFDDFDEEDDFGGESEEEQEDDEFEGEDEDFEGQDDEEVQGALESFQSFINKKK